jgi:hypothetical protein
VCFKNEATADLTCWEPPRRGRWRRLVVVTLATRRGRGTNGRRARRPGDAGAQCHDRGDPPRAVIANGSLTRRGTQLQTQLKLARDTERVSDTYPADLHRLIKLSLALVSLSVRKVASEAKLAVGTVVTGIRIAVFTSNTPVGV